MVPFRYMEESWKWWTISSSAPTTAPLYTGPCMKHKTHLSILISHSGSPGSGRKRQINLPVSSMRICALVASYGGLGGCGASTTSSIVFSEVLKTKLNDTTLMAVDSFDGIPLTRGFHLPCDSTYLKFFGFFDTNNSLAGLANVLSGR